MERKKPRKSRFQTAKSKEKRTGSDYFLSFILLAIFLFFDTITCGYLLKDKDTNQSVDK